MCRTLQSPWSDGLHDNHYVSEIFRVNKARAADVSNVPRSVIGQSSIAPAIGAKSMPE
jgi:hypothetical protein